MVRDGVVNALELFARLLGVGLSLLGVLSLGWTPVVGVPLLAVGLLFALRPATAAELVELAATLS